MRKEAFKSKGYAGVDVFKVTQTLPVCKGTKTGRTSGTERQERGDAPANQMLGTNQNLKPFHTLSYILKENWPYLSACHAGMLAGK